MYSPTSVTHSDSMYDYLEENQGQAYLSVNYPSVHVCLQLILG